MEVLSKNKIKYLKDNIPTDSKIISEYEGVFYQKNIREFSLELKKATSGYPITSKRLFYVYVELAQNVKFYSDEYIINNSKKTGIGSQIIYETENEIGFIIGNEINNKASRVLERKCKIINTLSRDSLRELKRYQRNLIPGTNGGAHIGMIMVSLTTRKTLDYFIKKINDSSNYFILNVIIEKNQKI